MFKRASGIFIIQSNIRLSVADKSLILTYREYPLQKYCNCTLTHDSFLSPINVFYGMHVNSERGICFLKKTHLVKFSLCLLS